MFEAMNLEAFVSYISVGVSVLVLEGNLLSRPESQKENPENIKKTSIISNFHKNIFFSSVVVVENFN